MKTAMISTLVLFLGASQSFANNQFCYDWVNNNRELNSYFQINADGKIIPASGKKVVKTNDSIEISDTAFDLSNKRTIVKVTPLIGAPTSIETTVIDREGELGKNTTTFRRVNGKCIPGNEELQRWIPHPTDKKSKMEQLTVTYDTAMCAEISNFFRKNPQAKECALMRGPVATEIKDILNRGVGDKAGPWIQPPQGTQAYSSENNVFRRAYDYQAFCMREVPGYEAVLAPAKADEKKSQRATD